MRSYQYSLKLALAFVLSFGLRLIPFRPANVEPVLATFLPFSHRVNGVVTALLTAASMITYDALTYGIGSWTWTTAITYAVLAWIASVIFARIAPSRGNYALFAIIATLIFDIITGPIAISLMTTRPFWEVTLAQIPFTLSHLVSNALIAAIVVPWIAKVFVDNPALNLVVPEKRPATGEALS